MPGCASAGSLTNWAEEKILKHILGIDTWTAPSSVYIGLGAFGETTNAELSGNGYQRQQLHFSDPTTGSLGASLIKTCCPIVFGPASFDWDAVGQFGIFDAKSGGNLITWGPLGDSLTVRTGQQLRIEAEKIDVQVDYSTGATHRWCQYLQEKILRHIFMGQSYSPPSIYAAITHDEPSFLDPPSAPLDEPSGTGTGYSRPQLTGWRVVKQDANGYAVSSLSSYASFGTALTDWFPAMRIQNYVALVDAASGGNILGYSSTSIGQTIVAGDTAILSAIEDQTIVGVQ